MWGFWWAICRRHRVSWCLRYAPNFSVPSYAIRWNIKCVLNVGSFHLVFGKQSKCTVLLVHFDLIVGTGFSDIQRVFIQQDTIQGDLTRSKGKMLHDSQKSFLNNLNKLERPCIITSVETSVIQQISSSFLGTNCKSLNFWPTAMWRSINLMRKSFPVDRNFDLPLINLSLDLDLKKNKKFLAHALKF